MSGGYVATIAHLHQLVGIQRILSEHDKLRRPRKLFPTALALLAADLSVRCIVRYWRTPHRLILLFDEARRQGNERVCWFPVQHRGRLSLLVREHVAEVDGHLRILENAAGRPQTAVVVVPHDLRRVHPTVEIRLLW